MTWLGKIQVLLNLALSVGLAAWAMLFYTTRIDWTDQKGKNGKPDGELVLRKKQAEDDWNLIPAAAYNWEIARSKLSAMEIGSPKFVMDGKEYKINGRLPNRVWYREELEFPRRRKKENDDQPSRVLVLDDQLRLTFTDTDPLTPRPRMAGGTDRLSKPLRYLEWYNKEEKTLLASLKEEDERLEKAIKEDTELTKLLTGDRALHIRLREERLKLEGIMADHGLVKNPLVSTYVESELLLKRKRALEARLEELRKVRAARLAALGGK